MKHTLENMPESARLWVYAFDRDLNEAEASRVADSLDAFITEWHSHEFPVSGSYVIKDNRFVLISGYCEDGISGCSTDSSVRVIKELTNALGVDGLNTSLVHYRNASGTINSVSREAFQEIVNRGEVSNDTIVFDLTLQTIKDLRDRQMEKDFANSWHSQAFSRA